MSQVTIEIFDIKYNVYESRENDFSPAHGWEEIWSSVFEAIEL